MTFKEPSTPSEFEEYYNSANKCIVYYTAQWCGPCRAIAPVFEKLANENPDITFIKVDIDKLNGLPNVASISSVPTFKFYNNKSQIMEFSGASESKLREGIKKLNE